MRRRARTWFGIIGGRRQSRPPLTALAADNRRLGNSTPRHSLRRQPRTTTGRRFFQQLDDQRVFFLSGNKNLWLTLAKLLLAVSPLLLAMQWQLTVTFDKYSRAVVESRAAHHVLLENQAALDTLRNRLSSPEHIRIMAAKKLSLYSPNKGQIELF